MLGINMLSPPSWSSASSPRPWVWGAAYAARAITPFRLISTFLVHLCYLSLLSNVRVCQPVKRRAVNLFAPQNWSNDQMCAFHIFFPCAILSFISLRCQSIKHSIIHPDWIWFKACIQVFKKSNSHCCGGNASVDIKFKCTAKTEYFREKWKCD